MRRARSLGLLGAATLVAGALGGCGSSTIYSYVDVAIEVDTSTFSAEEMKRVGNCQVVIAGADDPLPINLTSACPVGLTPANLGTFQWTTTKTSGWLTFEVLFYLFDSGVNPLARGISPQVNIVKGQRVSTQVSVLGIPSMMGEGTGGAAGTGGAGGGGAGGAPGAGGAVGAGGGGGGAGTDAAADASTDV